MSVAFDINAIRAEFPVLGSEVYGKPLVYLDNAASAQKPLKVIERMQHFSTYEYANVHRGLHYLSNNATNAFEAARETTREFLNAETREQIIFAGGATDAINLVAYGFLEPQIEAGDEIIISEMEHHSNIVPWHFMRERHGAVLKWVPVTDAGELDMAAYEAAFSDKTKFVALTQMSNALGTITPSKQLVDIAHKHNVPILLDGCQGAVHLKTDVQKLGADFYVFSGHKVYGPTGIGVLWGRYEHLQAMRELEIEVRAKHHCLAHMVRKLLKYGTPALWACWRDESDNHQLAQLASRAHRLVWSRRVISEHRVAYGSRAAKRKTFR